MSGNIELGRVREVLARNKARLMAQPGVQGVGIGAQDGGHVIVVYVNARDKLKPPGETIEGVPVRYVFTGTITPMI